MSSRLLSPRWPLSRPLRNFTHLQSRCFVPTAKISTQTRLYEYVVVIHDKPSSRRPSSTASAFDALHGLTFAGNILDPSEKVCGDVLACQATSIEEITAQLHAHPFAKDVWDMARVTVRPLQTIHTSPLDVRGGSGYRK